MPRYKQNNKLLPFNLEDHLHETFLVGGYRTDKPQLRWILGKHPKRENYLYNVRFCPCRQSCRDGAIEPGELPTFVVLYSFANCEKAKPRMFRCLSYSICSKAEMEVMGYPNPDHSYIVYRLGEEYFADTLNIQQIDVYARAKYPQLALQSKQNKSNPFMVTGQDIVYAQHGELPFANQYEPIRIIDLFAGLGGFHHSFDKLGQELGFDVQCEFVSELKGDLRALYQVNYNVPAEIINSDITLLNSQEEILRLVPEHDILCGGFPCQPFSKAGKQEGFNDEEGRGVLFNYIADIIRVRRPKFIFLENVANLEKHDEGNTWRVIQDRLNRELNYDIRAKVISPHEYGFPQYRKRIYIVGIDRERGNLDNFTWPARPFKATCDITAIMEDEPTHPQPIKDVQQRYIDVWQQFLNLCVEHEAKLPAAPIWAMEFGANYEYEELVPAKQPLAHLQGKCGKLGNIVHGNTVAECLGQLPNYAHPSKKKGKEDETRFPDWKITFIKENRKFYEANRVWIDPWKEQIRDWDNSFLKFEWNCDEDDVMNIEGKILQFRPSGLRVKRPTYSPALTFTNSQVPIFPGVSYQDEDGKKIRGRYMTMVEAARIQGMGELNFDGLKKTRIYEALGNAVDVEIVKLIAKNLIKCDNH
ncbi:MAG: DNA (cytosine-5-)-methyltransferase [Bacteroidaceae bacterium]|nr:DNA (cytosine-5-)-methyltransferase [Bacteroidaceae bacterium]